MTEKYTCLVREKERGVEVLSNFSKFRVVHFRIAISNSGIDDIDTGKISRRWEQYTSKVENWRGGKC